MKSCYQSHLWETSWGEILLKYPGTAQKRQIPGTAQKRQIPGTAQKRKISGMPKQVTPMNV